MLYKPTVGTIGAGAQNGALVLPEFYGKLAMIIANRTSVSSIKEVLARRWQPHVLCCHKAPKYFDAFVIDRIKGKCILPELIPILIFVLCEFKFITYVVLVGKCFGFTRNNNLVGFDWLFSILDLKYTRKYINLLVIPTIQLDLLYSRLICLIKITTKASTE